MESTSLTPVASGFFGGWLAPQGNHIGLRQKVFSSEVQKEMVPRLMTSPEIETSQKNVCKKYGASFFPSPSNLKVGISLNVRDGAVPINGLRHPPEGDTTGWYIYAGEGVIPNDDAFFKPLHVIHIDDWCPQIKKYLGLPPGWRFLIAGDYEDVWFDENLLNI
jgi:hypothetical protein